MSDEIFAKVEISEWPVQARILKRNEMQEYRDHGHKVTQLVSVPKEVRDAIWEALEIHSGLLKLLKKSESEKIQQMVVQGEAGIATLVEWFGQLEGGA